MRALCQASHLERVQEEICGRSVSLGSFSAMQHVLDPGLLREVFGQLVKQRLGNAKGDARLVHLNWVAQDGSLWSALPRMAWAEYGVGRTGQAKGVRLHLRFHVTEDQPIDARVTRDEPRVPVLSGCVRARVLGGRFPAPKERTAVVMTLRFSRRGR